MMVCHTPSLEKQRKQRVSKEETASLGLSVSCFIGIRNHIQRHLGPNTGKSCLCYTQFHTSDTRTGRHTGFIYKSEHSTDTLMEGITGVTK